MFGGGATNIRANFPQFFGTTKLPELEAVILAKNESYPSMIPILFNEEIMTTDIYQTTTMSGLKNPVIKPENQPVQFQTLQPGFAKTYTAVTWATGYRISKEMVDDGKFSFIERATNSFSKGMFEIKELSAAAQYDNGFTVNGYDGQPLFSTTHPLENGGGAVGVNRPSDPSELSITSYRELRNIMQDTVNENNQRVRYSPAFMVLPHTLQDVGKEIVNSMYNPEDGNNAVNTAYNAVQLMPGGFWNYLSSQTAWFLQTDRAEHGLMFMDRQGLETDSDYDKRSMAWEVICNIRFDFGSSAWRGVCGNPGA